MLALANAIYPGLSACRVARSARAGRPFFGRLGPLRPCFANEVVPGFNSMDVNLVKKDWLNARACYGF